ncbi:hypothetical protein [Rhodococcus tibetensis]|uniref:RelA/SpoT domain-containing protein n=1 Tax=Rhodococcus tibetensis TaxID=2965064 RepID=A0ABT1QE74_9NOCA|nr:hypothetical protein [Rhodococcus sp. FXJ9.536]MCQ4120594.1 hypothetical protein [Rhodococcus sp. FXJ9.536]
MKVATSVRNEFDRQFELNSLIKSSADELIRSSIRANWHFESRLKNEQSFALKVETGRFDPAALEDFYACTVVVPNLAMMREAENRMRELFVVFSRKPKDDDIATGDATTFSFDHTRLYANLKPSPGKDEESIHRIGFEIQIKTFLQHAWSIATHDLTYKTTKVSWGKERVAAQVKAALEAAEVSILEAETLASQNTSVLHRQDIKTKELLQIIEVMYRSFDVDDLPDDMKRLADSIRSLFRRCRISLDELGAIVESGRRLRGGVHPMNLSPFLSIVQYLFDVRPDVIAKALGRNGDIKILVPDEIVVPSSIDLGSARGVLRLRGR